MEQHRDVWWPSPGNDRAQVVELPGEEPFRCQYGGEIAEIQVSWEEWGSRNEGGDNTVLVIHPMTADCHVTGGFDGQAAGWWEDLIGPGRAIDTDRLHVVCPDLLGGCYGTTGPRHPAPDGEPWLGRFPLVTPRDIMRVQRRFLDALDVPRPALVIGPSMGGMIAWEWALEASAGAERVAVVAAPLETTPLQIAWNWLQRSAAEVDLDGEGGISGKAGRRIARGVGMLSYRSPAGLAEKFGRTWFKSPGSTLGEPGLFNIESWLRQHGNRIAKKYDPWTWRLFARTMDLHDVAEGRKDLEAALGSAAGETLVIGIRSDHLYPVADVRRGFDRLTAAGATATYAEIDSDHGHDAFLIDVDQIAAFLRDWWPD